jgi:uncharacterized protein
LTGPNYYYSIKGLRLNINTTYDIQPRRQDRSMTDPAWMAALLGRAPYGVLALAAGGRPYARTNLFAFDPKKQACYMHSADEGRTIASVRSDPEACFTVAEMGRLLPAPLSRGFSVEFASVVIFGQIQVVEDILERLHGLELLMAKYAPHLKPGQDYAALSEDELGGVAVYRLDIRAWSGKQKSAPADFPGAYSFSVPEGSS